MALHLAEHFAHAPERLRLFEAVGDGRVGDEAAFAAPAPGCPRITSRRPLARCEESSISTYQGCGVAERIAAAGGVAQHEFDAGARHQLEAGDVAAGVLRGDVEQIERGLRRSEARRRRSRPRAAAAPGAAPPR